MKTNLLPVLICAQAAAFGCNGKAPEQASEPKAKEATVAAQSKVDAQPEAALEPPKPTQAVTLEGAHTTALDLLVNRPHAHMTYHHGAQAGLAVDGASPSFLRYIAGNHAAEWQEAELEGRKAHALRKKRIATMWFPALVEGPAQLKIELFNPASSKNALELSLNGKKLPKQELAPGWNVVSLELPAVGLENELQLDFASMGRIGGVLSGGAVGKMFVGAARGEDAPDVVDLAIGDGPFRIQPSAGAVFHVWDMPGGALDLELSGEPGCEISVAVAGASGPADAKTFHVEEGKTRAGLMLPGRDRVARLVFAPTEKTCSEGVVLESAKLLAPGAAAAADVPAPERVVVWLIDTLRADHLPIHFDTDVHAPNLKKLAEEGASFETAYVQGNESKTSHASLFSGMFPSKHRVLGRGHLKPEHHLLPEAMKDAGYKSYAFISNGYVSEPWGFVQGWDMYRNNLRQGYRIDGPSMAKQGVDWAVEHRSEKFFLYLGTIDPHVTYREHADLIGRYDDPGYNGRFKRSLLGSDLGKIKGGGIKVTDREKDRIKALYKNEIEFNDQAFGALRAGLEEAGLWEKTMVIVTADHGDEFWEHGSVGHGHSVSQELVHVPLLVYYPPAVPAGTVVRSGADVLDIYPTIIDAVGGKVPDDVQGRSLFGQIHKVRADYPEPAIATRYLSHYGVQAAQWKLLAKKGEYELYDRKSDPLEQRNVKGQHPFESRWLLDGFSWFRAHRKEWRKAEHGTPTNLAPGFRALLEAGAEE